MTALGRGVGDMRSGAGVPSALRVERIGGGSDGRVVRDGGTVVGDGCGSAGNPSNV